MSMQYNPLIKYGFDEVGSPAGGGTTPPSQNVDVIAKVKEEVARSSAEMSWVFNFSYARYLTMSSFSCFKAFGFCNCNAYIQVKDDFRIDNDDSLLFLSDRSIDRWYFNFASVVVTRWDNVFFFPARGTDAAYIILGDGASFDLKKNDNIIISKSFNYTAK